MAYNDWEAVIGLEIHAQLNTKSKIFSADPAEFSQSDNLNVSAVSLGFPGTLPVMNKEVINKGIKAGLALNCQINPHSIFERKNYFYPDLAKGYQISQYKHPLCGEGFVTINLNGQTRTIRIERAHLEEDAGKSLHQTEGTLINYNRAGVPLLEIVSAPEMSYPQEAAAYAKTVRQILKYAEVCDGNLEEGSLRCDCNVSVRPVGQKEFGTKVELKNINSFRFIEKAIEFEIQRQIDLLDSNEVIVQETRLYDSTKNKTFSMRSKEESEDYRYFPDPDLFALHIDPLRISDIKRALPELPEQKIRRFIAEYKISEQDALFLTEEKPVAQYFELAVGFGGEPKMVANWIMTEVYRELNASHLQIESSPIPPQQLAELLLMISKGEISGKIAKNVFQLMWQESKAAVEVLVEKGWKQVSNDSVIEGWIEEVVSVHHQQVQEYLEGKTKVFGFLMGQVMKLSKGQANPGAVKEILKEKLK